jgi:NADH-quinone oxidoreductase subunit L
MAAAIAAALVFCGAMGKSAQFPLHVWLPDAMEGPTPVSALMHAATMVAAGIYMVIRVYFVFEDTAWAPTLVAWLGGITAFIAATMAITQSDIKKVLAYSTLSQLGYMTMALGAGAYSASMFHLLTHAFFKALFHMGGLRKRLRSTHWTWAIGTLALCGIPPFAGFWSKDEILGATLETGHVAGHFALFVVGLVTAGLTAFYMGRAWYLTFGGEYRGHADPHESPKVMTVPLWSLAVFSVFIGFVGLPGPNNHFEKFLEAWNPNGGGSFHPPVAALALLLGVAGLLGARALYRKAEPGTDPLPAKLGPLWTLWSRLYYVDDFYLWLVKKVQQGIAHVCWLFERWVIIQGFVNGIAQTVREGGDNLRRSETGRASGYVTSFVLGAMAVALLMLLVVHGR